MNRRNFIQLSSIGAITGVITPKDALACSDNMAGGLYYTKDAPGRWSKKVKGHLPNLEVSKQADQASIHIVTLHEMKGYTHYISKHIVLDKHFKFITEKLFDPMKDEQPVSEHALGNYSGRIHVLSVCNTHDTWLNLVDI